MSYSKQLKKQQKKKAREKSVKKETTKVQNKSTKAPTNINPNTAISEKYLEKLQTSFNNSLAELEPEEFIHKFSDQYRLNMINGLAKNHFLENIEAYYLESVLTNNIRIFNNFVYEGKFFKVDMIKNSVKSSGMSSLNVLLSEVFGATQAFLLMPYVVKVNKEENRNDINEKYINKLNEQLSSYLEEKLTLDTLEQFMNNIASKIPNIYKFALANTPKNEQDLHKINERYSKANDLNEDLNITNQLANNNRNKCKERLQSFHNLMTIEYPRMANNFREKYITNNYDLKYDPYSNKYTEKDYEEFVQSLYEYIEAVIFVEDYSTEMKLVYYYRGDRNLYDEVGAELGFKTEELINKCEYELKHKIREYVLPYGELVNIFDNVEPVDKITWNILKEEEDFKRVSIDHENFYELFTNHKFVMKIYKAMTADFFTLKKIDNKLSFEDILKHEISEKIDFITSKIEAEFNENIFNNPNFEFDFNTNFNLFELAAEIVEKVKNTKIRINENNEISFENIFEKEGFKTLLIKKVADNLLDYKDSFENLCSYFKTIVKTKENISERINKFMKHRLIKEHAKRNNEQSKSLRYKFDYFDLEGFKADYEKVLEILNISKDSQEFKEIDLIISTNIEAIKIYNETTIEEKEDKKNNRRRKKN